MIVRALAVLSVVFAAACFPPPPVVLTAPPSSPPVTRSATASPSPTPTATAAPSPTPAPTPAPTSYVSPRGTITVDQPRAFARVTSPLPVSGSASLFEAAFSWTLTDLAGKELAKGNGMASAGAPARGTFQFSVTFTVTADTYGYLHVTSHSARDGSVDDEARVPLVLAAR